MNADTFPPHPCKGTFQHQDDQNQIPNEATVCQKSILAPRLSVINSYVVYTKWNSINKKE